DKLTALGIVVILIATTISIAAQQTQTDPQKARPRTTATVQKPAGNTDRLEPDDTSRPPSDISDDITANRKEQMSEAAAVDPYYNNFFSTYKLGPEDVISIEVFNQPRYSRSGVTVPPSGRISLALI